MKCTLVKIQLKDGATPYSVGTARRIPIPLLDKVEAEWKRMKEENIIQEITEPTEWVAPSVPAVKRNDKIRICVDWKKLDQAVKRVCYIIPAVNDVVHQLRSSSVFSKLDVVSGFLANSTGPRDCQADNIHYRLREVDHQSAFCSQLSTRDFSENDVRSCRTSDVLSAILTTFSASLPTQISTLNPSAT